MNRFSIFNSKIIDAYANMIFEGTAFNKNKIPDVKRRKKILKELDMYSVKLEYKDFFITEEEFKV